MESNPGQVIDLGGLYHRFEGLADKRKPKGKRYALATILLGIFLAKLCGEDKPSGIAEWVALCGEWIAKTDAQSPHLSTGISQWDRSGGTGKSGTQTSSALWGKRLSSGGLHGREDTARHN